MASVTVLPNGDGSDGGGTITYSSGTTKWSLINNGVSTPVDTDWIGVATDGTYFYIQFENMPVDFDTITAVTINYRNGRVGKSPNIYGTARLYKSDESTALTNQITLDHQVGVGNNSTAFTITGDTDKTSWDGVTLWVGTTDSIGSLFYYEIELDITYSVAAAGGDDNGKMGKFLLFIDT